MAAGKLLTLAALAGLALAPIEAKAEKPKPTIADTAKKAISADTTKDGKRITRNYLSFNTGYSRLNLNGKEHETGYSLGADASVNYQASKWLNIKSNVKFSYGSMGFKDINATESDSNLSLSLEGRVKLHSSKNLRLLLGLGAGYELKNDEIIFDGEKARQRIDAAGPEMSLGLESRYFDFYVAGSVLFGKKSSTFDAGRNITMQKVSITLVPRYWKLDMPMTAEVYHWAINDRIKDRDNILIAFGMQPGIKVVPNFRLYMDFKYHQFYGDDQYNTLHVGLGGKLEW